MREKIPQRLFIQSLLRIGALTNVRYYRYCINLAVTLKTLKYVRIAGLKFVKKISDMRPKERKRFTTQLCRIRESLEIYYN